MFGPVSRITCVLLVGLVGLFTACYGQQIEVVVSPERRLVAAGKSVGFECGYELPPGHTKKSVIWQNSHSGQTLQSANGILILRSVTEADSGIYTCAVQSEGPGRRPHRNWAHATLTVVASSNVNQVRPKVSVQPGGIYGGLVIVRPGGQVEMTGLATGHPLPYFNWKRASGKPLPRSRHRLTNGKLTISDVRIPDDVDEYVCTATNVVGEDSESRYVVGGWESWRDWGMCSVSCGTGTQSRSRRCVLPPRLPEALKRRACPGQRDSSGMGTETRVCNPGRCPPPPTTRPPPTTTPTTRRAAPTRPARPAPPQPQPRPPTTTAVSPTTQPPVSTPPPAVGSGLEYRGCYQDHVARRVLRYHYRNYWRYITRMHPQICIRHCERYGHRYAGMENRAECWCGTLDIQRAPRSNGCVYPCGGNSGLACGGRNALSIYEVPQRGAMACAVSRWGAWTQLYGTCGWAVQSRTRYLRNPSLYCSTVPRLRQQRLIRVKPCFSRLRLPPSCGKVLQRERLSYPLGSGGKCLSDAEVDMTYCMGACGSRCTYRKTTSVNVPFTCPNENKVTIRVAQILQCQCR